LGHRIFKSHIVKIDRNGINPITQLEGTIISRINHNTRTAININVIGNLWQIAGLGVSTTRQRRSGKRNAVCRVGAAIDSQDRIRQCSKSSHIIRRSAGTNDCVLSGLCRQYQHAQHQSRAYGWSYKSTFKAARQNTA
jgi:hypothetical protein